MKLKNILFFILCLAFIKVEAKDKHPYHMGSIDIHYNAKTERFEIIGKFFIDDMENAINKKYKTTLQFLNAQQKSAMQNKMADYFGKHFKLKVNQQWLEVKFLGYEEDNEAVNIYMESQKIENPKIVEVALNAIYNLFTDQANIVHITIDGKRKSFKLDYPNYYLVQKF